MLLTTVFLTPSVVFRTEQMLNKYKVNEFSESVISSPYDILWKREWGAIV